MWLDCMTGFDLHIHTQKKIRLNNNAASRLSHPTSEWVPDGYRILYHHIRRNSSIKRTITVSSHCTKQSCILLWACELRYPRLSKITEDFASPVHGNRNWGHVIVLSFMVTFLHYDDFVGDVEIVSPYQVHSRINRTWTGFMIDTRTLDVCLIQRKLKKKALA